jgi:membrane protein DedA with SNARE-associated domain
MEFHEYVEQVIAFVRDNAAWAPPIVFALAFGESLAFISLLIPAWGRWSRSAR